MHTSRWIRGAMVVAGATALVALGTTQASAATPRNGVCEAGEFCYYYGPGRSGSVSDFTTSVANYGATQPSCYEFRTPGQAGYGQCIKNNATYAWNRSSSRVTVFYNSNYGGPSDVFAPGQAGDLVNTYLNNASHRFG